MGLLHGLLVDLCIPMDSHELCVDLCIPIEPHGLQVDLWFGLLSMRNKLLGTTQKRTMKMVKCLEGKPHGEWLSPLGLLSLEETEGKPHVVHSFLKVGSWQGSAGFFSLVTSNKTQGAGPGLYKGSSDLMLGKGSSVRVAQGNDGVVLVSACHSPRISITKNMRHWNRLSGDVDTAS
ncbi:hypothetical protein TURU_010500 [Turdus rufiventris]|nr:hypothetical protein TURU_010500 [Turdus rufiventris]